MFCGTGKLSSTVPCVKRILNYCVGTRQLSAIRQKVHRICIVGAGPAGFYAAMHISKNVQNVKIDIIEKLPVPFGLIRYGVAPDHPEVKNVIHQFTKVAEQSNVSFYGNITLGADVSLATLRQYYDAVLLTYGAENDKLLGVDNEDAVNVVAARQFVGWYNGLPSERDFKVDLSGSTAAVLGQGNVALDVARILLSPIDELRKTDIPEYALEVLAQSKVKELYLIGRRGPLQVAFTIKELREQLKLNNCRTEWREEDFVGVEDIASKLVRPRKRLTELMLKSLKEKKEPTTGEKVFKPVFHRSPEKIIVDKHNKVTGVQLICNKMVGKPLEEQKCIATGEKEIIKCDLVLRSIGYRSAKNDNDLKIDGNGVVPNDQGRIIDVNTSDLAPLYVAGWLGTGPVGVILHTMGNAFQVAKVICEDIKSQDGNDDKGGFEELRKILCGKIIDWTAWQNIDKQEVELGKKLGKPREKLCSIEELLKAAHV